MQINNLQLKRRQRTFRKELMQINNLQLKRRQRTFREELTALKPLLPALLLTMNVGRRLITLLQLIAKESYRHREGISKPRKPSPKPDKHMTQKQC